MTDEQKEQRANQETDPPQECHTFGYKKGRKTPTQPTSPPGGPGLQPGPPATTTRRQDINPRTWNFLDLEEFQELQIGRKLEFLGLREILTTAHGTTTLEVHRT